MSEKYLYTAFYRRREADDPRPPATWLGVHTIRHLLFAPFALLLAALALTAEAQNRHPPETATMSHSANHISLRAPDRPPLPIYFLSQKVQILPHPGSTTWDHTNSNPCIVPNAVLAVVPRMYGNGHLGQTISLPMRTCGSHTVGETFRMTWLGDSSKAWRRCESTPHGERCSLHRTGTGTPARAYFSFDLGPNCEGNSVVTTEMGLVQGATHCWTDVTIQ